MQFAPSHINIVMKPRTIFQNKIPDQKSKSKFQMKFQMKNPNQNSKSKIQMNFQIQFSLSISFSQFLGIPVSGNGRKWYW